MAQVIRRSVTATNQRIGINNFDTDAAAVGQALANAGETLRRKAFEIDTKKATQTGEDAARAVEASKFKQFVNGTPIAMQAPEGYGDVAREAYRRVAERRFVDTIDQDIRLKAQELSVKHARSPLAFKNEMDGYLTSLGENADGRFREFIINAGTAVKEGSYLGLLDQERKRTRVEQAQFLGAQNIEHTEMATTKAYQLDLSTALSIVANRQEATSDGEQAEIIPKGSSLTYFDGAVGRVAGAYLGSIIANETNALTRKQIVAMITSRGNLGNASEEVQKLFNQTIKYKLPDGKTADVKLKDLITSTNYQSVATVANAINGDMDAIDAEIQARKAEELRNEAEALRQNSIRTDDKTSELFQNLTDQGLETAIDAFAADAPEGEIINNLAALGQRYKQFEDYINDIPAEIMSGDQKRAKLQEVRTVLQQTYLARAAGEGNPENFKAGLANPESKAFGLMTPKQQAVVTGLHNYGLYEVGDDNAVSATISLSSSELVLRMQKEAEYMEFLKEYTQLNSDVLNGTVDSSEIADFLKRSNVSAALSPDQKLGFKRGLNLSSSINSLKTFGANLNSNQLTVMAQFIKNGVDLSEDGFAQLSEEQKNAALNATEGMNESEREAIGRNLEQMAAVRRMQEAEAKVESDKQQYRIDFYNSKVDYTSQKAKDFAQEELDRIGFDLSDNSTWTDNAMVVLQFSVATEIENQFDSLAAGRPTASVENLLQLYERLAKFEYKDGTKRNFLKGQLKDVTRNVIDAAFLGNQFGLYKNMTEAFNSINMEARNASSKQVADYKSAVFIDAEEGKSISPAEYVSKILGDEADYVVNNELGAIANQLAGLMIPKEIIEKQIQGYFDERYQDAKYVVDPARPIGAKGKSRHALSVIFNNDPDLERYALEQINNELVKNGYTLANIHEGFEIDPTEPTDPTDVEGRRRRKRPTDKMTDQENLQGVVLVPMFPNVVRPADQVFQVMRVVSTMDGLNELIPLLLDDSPMGFRLSDEIKDYVSPTMTSANQNMKTLEEIRREKKNVDTVMEALTGSTSYGFAQ